MLSRTLPKENFSDEGMRQMGEEKMRRWALTVRMMSDELMFPAQKEGC